MTLPPRTQHRIGLASIGLLIALGCGDVTVPHQQVQHSIRNGSTAPTIIDAPWLEGAIVWFHEHHLPDHVLCTGLLLTPRIVLTAGHCLENADNLMISHHVEGDRKTYAVRSSELHPQLDLGIAALHRSAALLIENHLTLNNALSLDELTAQRIEVAGYGETYEANRTAELRYGALTVVKVTDFELEVDGFGERGLCFGDSGAPAFMTLPNHSISPIAIATHGDSTCLDKDYLTRIDAALEWILNTTNTLDLSHEEVCEHSNQDSVQCVGERLVGCLANQVYESECPQETRCAEYQGVARCATREESEPDPAWDRMTTMPDSSSNVSPPQLSSNGCTQGSSNCPFDPFSVIVVSIVWSVKRSRWSTPS